MGRKGRKEGWLKRATTRFHIHSNCSFFTVLASESVLEERKEREREKGNTLSPFITHSYISNEAGDGRRDEGKENSLG